MSKLNILLATIILASIICYIANNQHGKENFTEIMGPIRKTSNTATERPYISDPINNVDDYEYNIVFKNEGSRAMSADLKNKLMTQRPLDWTNLPPNSAGFQEGLEVEAGAETRTMETPYYEIRGYEPPDEDAMEEAEKKILSTYKPSRSNDAGKYDIEDAKELIEKIYKERGLVPEIVAKPNNIYEVVGTQEINPKIIWEDQAPVQYGGSAAIIEAGEQTINVPYTAGDPDKALDPYFDKRPKTRDDKWDYRQWTPGLERMFGPTQPQAQWY